MLHYDPKILGFGFWKYIKKIFERFEHLINYYEIAFNYLTKVTIKDFKGK